MEYLLIALWEWLLPHEYHHRAIEVSIVCIYMFSRDRRHVLGMSSSSHLCIFLYHKFLLDKIIILKSGIIINFIFMSEGESYHEGITSTEPYRNL